ncbi:MAG: zinc-dependent metalloprotease [Chitinophagales bacterium]|nr:zinc-dependent metalloprotease [Chitinophagales bacterium]
MKNSLFRLCIWLCFASLLTNLHGQSARHEPCGTSQIRQQLIQENPELKLLLEENEKILDEFRKKQEGKNNTEKMMTTITIPVVFHVIWYNQYDNTTYSDNVINGILNNLNIDFSGSNTDYIPPAFAGLKANTGIQFCLAKQDPCGLPTTGIIRKQTNVSVFTLGTGNQFDMFNSALGGDNIWDRNKYLNIYICSLSGAGGFVVGPLLPSASIDGVVVGFGNGTTSAFTHEVGHWLNLEHTFGTTPSDQTQTCNDNDFVGDTPNQEDPNYGCPTFPQISCNNGPNGDMYMNYMDYTNDNCQTMFSIGQSDRMNFLFNPAATIHRRSLLTSNGCVVPATMSIAGNSCINSNADFFYSVQNLPPNANVTWTVTPAGVVNLFPQPNKQLKIVRIGNATNAITITATITGCNNSVIKTKTVNIGLPYTLYPANPVSPPEAIMETGMDEGPCNSQCYSPGGPGINWNAPIAYNTTGVTWQKLWSLPANYGFWSGNTNSMSLFFKAANQSVEFVRTVSNTCGSIQEYYCFGSNTTLCSARLASSDIKQTIKIYPNPISADCKLQISIDDYQSFTTEYGENIIVQISDAGSKLVLEQPLSNLTGEGIGITNLSSGIYFVRIMGNSKTSSLEKLIVK